PTSLRSVTSVMPESRENTPQPGGIFNQLSATLLRLTLRYIEPLGIEKRPILDVQRQLQKRFRTEWTEHLRCPAAIPDGLVVPFRGIVIITGLVQNRSRVSIAQQPVHADADSGLSGNF